MFDQRPNPSVTHVSEGLSTREGIMRNRWRSFRARVVGAVFAAVVGSVLLVGPAAAKPAGAGGGGLARPATENPVGAGPISTSR